MPPGRWRRLHLDLLEEQGRRPFDLERGPLFSPWLLELGEGRRTLVLGLHHIVADGWSVRLLGEELSVLYATFLAGRPSPLSPLPWQYADFAREQRAQGEEALARSAAFWREALAGAPSLLELPTDRPRPAAPSFAGRERGRPFPPGLLRRVRALAAVSGATPFGVHLAAFSAYLGRLTGQGDLMIGTPVANRTRPEVEGLVGFFVNTLAVRLRPRETTFARWLAEVMRIFLAGLSHQEMPLEKIIEDQRIERSLAFHPLFQVLVATQEHPTLPPLPGLAAAWRPSPVSSAKLDLSLIVEEEGEMAGAFLEYALELFDATTIDRHLDAYLRLLEAAAN
ncbi:MAG TPA: condensation domain-containing protein, partial [Methylomirabilota bacterium]|nr:condensation domain-containing protein [Methylomirabilota bacterium]